MLADPSLLAVLGSTPKPAASRASSAPAASEATNGPAAIEPPAAEPVGETSDTGETDTSGKEDEGKDDLDSLLDQLN